MKKLLLIALLMLALVVTAVACSDDKPADTTIGETTAAPAPGVTTAEPDADTTAEPAPETTVAPAPETTEAPAPETTEAPAPETTEAPAPETTEAPVDPADPIGVYEADKISTIVGGDPSNITQDCVSLEDGYLHVVPIGADPYWYPFANVKGARYVSIRYRTDATGADIQMYIGSTGAGPSNDDSMLRQPVVADGEWHLAIFDTQEIIDKGLYDGSTVSYFRFDALEAGYKLDENGEKYYIEGTETWARYTLPENCYIDVEYIAFFNTAEYAAAYDFAKNPPYVAPDAAGKVGISYDSFWVNGQDYFNTAATGQVNLKLDQANNTIAFDAGAAHETVMLRGWAGFNQPIASYGYFVDNYSMVYGEFTVEAEGPVKDAGGEHATRYEITIPVADLEPGVHTVGFVVKLEDGTVVLLHKEIKIVVVPTYTEKTVVLGIRNSDTPFTGSEKKFGQRFQVTEGFVIGITIDAMATYDDGNVNKWAFKVWQWKGNYADTVAGTPLFATTGENHANCQAFTVAIPATAYVTGDIFYEIEYVEGTKSFTGWTAGDLYAGIESYVDGALKDGGYSASMVVGVAFEGEFVEGDASNVFASDINANTAGTDLKNSDLGSHFAADYGAGARHTVIDKDGTLLYNIGDFNALSTKPNGKYAFTVKNLYTENPGFSGIFVRALRKATVEGQFYGADGNDADVNSYGGSGIYIAMLDETTLRINVKSYVDGKYVPNIYTATVASNDITVVDDGATVYVLAGDALVATIAINGTNDYGIAGVAADQASASATLTIGGETYEIANAILAAACDVENTIGLATRGGGNMTFSEVIIAGFSTVTIPGVGEPEAPVVENLVIDMATLGGAGFRADFAAAGYNAPLQLLGYAVTIDLGNIDLSKYSAVKITYGCDGGPGTEANFAAASSLAIGLKSQNTSYGQATDDNFDGDIAHTDMVFSSSGWAGGARDAVVDLTNVDYNGNVWVAVHNPAGTEIAISAIEFIAK